MCASKKPFLEKEGRGAGASPPRTAQAGQQAAHDGGVVLPAVARSCAGQQVGQGVRGGGHALQH